MSNHVVCPRCGKLYSDSTWPADGWGYFVTQHDVDGWRGTEDPAEVVQDGERIVMCSCKHAVWIGGVGWLVPDDNEPFPRD